MPATIRVTSRDGIDIVYCGIGDDWVTPEFYHGGDSYCGGGGTDALDLSTYDSGTNSPIFVIDLR